MPRKLFTVGKGVLSCRALSLEFGIGITKAERSKKKKTPLGAYRINCFSFSQTKFV